MPYWNSRACRGCAQSTTSVFFPEAYRSAKENGSLFYDGTNAPPRTIRIWPKVMAYRAVVEGQPIDGLAFSDKESDLPSHQVDVSLPLPEQDLATPALNWFLPPE